MKRSLLPLLLLIFASPAIADDKPIDGITIIKDDGYPAPGEVKYPPSTLCDIKSTTYETKQKLREIWDQNTKTFAGQDWNNVSVDSGFYQLTFIFDGRKLVLTSSHPYQEALATEDRPLEGAINADKELGFKKNAFDRITQACLAWQKATPKPVEVFKPQPTPEPQY